MNESSIGCASRLIIIMVQSPPDSELVNKLIITHVIPLQWISNHADGNDTDVNLLDYAFQHHCVDKCQVIKDVQIQRAGFLAVRGREVYSRNSDRLLRFQDYF